MHITLFWHDRLPVKGYGGTQRVVVWLARGLAELGHEVSLIAGPGSRVPEARLVPVEVKTMRSAGFNPATHLPAGTDILHSFVPIYERLDLPYVWTQEGNFRPGRTPPPRTIFVSANHAERNGSRAFVYNGIDPDEFTFRAGKDDYDLFIGRLHREKGYQLAIEAARRAGRQLVLAGGWRPTLRRGARFLGSVDGAEKAAWLAGARCLWMPAQWDEPFGLTLAEALMSGTPVLGTHHGSLPEIISPDVGILADTVDGLVEAAGVIDARRNPEACRARAERWFTHRAMAEEYVRFYRQMLASGGLAEGRRAE